jgi:proteasome accessory factor A
VELIENGTAPEIEIAQPIDATKAISRDQNYDWIIELRDGRKISAIDVQRLYLRAAQASEHARDEETAWLLREWENVLNDLERDVSSTRDRIDWVAKKFLLTALQEEERLAWSDPWLQAIDLEYHNVMPEDGLFYELVRQDQMRRIVTEDEVTAAILAPPETTRAYFRGRSVARYHKSIAAVQWDEIVFQDGARSHRVALPEAALDERLERLHELCRSDLPFRQFMDGVRGITGS